MQQNHHKSFSETSHRAFEVFGERQITGVQYEKFTMAKSIMEFEADKPFLLNILFNIVSLAVIKYDLFFEAI